MSDSPGYDRWQARYADAAGHLFGSRPNHFLAACADLLPPAGRALSVADGDGRNGVWLAGQGLEVTSLDFSPVAQAKARDWAAQRGVTLDLVLADVHRWDYGQAVFDVVVEIFAQFSPPAERAVKWHKMRAALRPGGLLIVQGYTPKQLEHGTGGPGQPENLYTAALLRDGFAGFEVLRLTEEERVLDEGEGHSGLSAIIGLAARKPG